MTRPHHAIPPLPERIHGLAELAANLWWSWDPGARALFRAIDHPLWRLTRHNPIALLARVGPERLEACARDPHFTALYDAVWERFRQLSEGADTWFARTEPALGHRPVAYFCAEFALHNSVPIYSGGLGVLAGDHCKAASDLGVPLVGVGLLYSKGYFDQRIDPHGWQQDVPEPFLPALMPVQRVPGASGSHVVGTVRVFGRDVHIAVWRIQVGRVPLYLLDTDLEENDPTDRELSHRLYGGGLDTRLRQEWVLGVGGVRVLRALGVDPGAWHANEGHAAFMLLERLRELVACGTPFDQAVRQVQATSVFTTHTPVAAGHDVFPAAHVAACAGDAWANLGIEHDALLALGRHPDQDRDRFHMTVLAIRLSGRVNAVSRRHGEVTRRMWTALWPGRDAAQVPIRHVTNGVHLMTWMAEPVRGLLGEVLGEDGTGRLEAADLPERIFALDDARLWTVHLRLKSALMDFAHEEARQRWGDHWHDATQLVGAGTLLHAQAMTLGFARRFAAYKRAELVFRDPDRLCALLTDPQRPVQLVFAGKAHPADTPAKEMLQRIYRFTQDARFAGRIAFLEDYELHMAHRLVQGVDLWLNLPRVPLEACGTSGIKAALNGVPQLGTADGWWVEGYQGSNGWLIPPAPLPEEADAWDAEQLYRLLETEVVPLFYQRDERGIPTGWVRCMKHALVVTLQRFTAGRMLREYVRDYYGPALRGAPPDDSSRCENQ